MNIDRKLLINPDNLKGKARKSAPNMRKVTDVPPKKKYRIALRTVGDVKRLLSVTINELRREEINPLIAGKMFYGLTVLLQVMETKDLEKRISKLEEEVNTAYGN